MRTRARTGQRKGTSDTTRRSILRSAEHLLAHYGEEGLSIRELCARAGVTAPTVYHHFGDKQSLVDRVVDDCFAAFDRALIEEPAPADPVEALRWGFNRYLDYGKAHPTHYRLMFGARRLRPSTVGLASYDRLRSGFADVAAAGRLRTPVDEATAAYWAALHGVTSLVIAGALDARGEAVRIVREAIVGSLTKPPGRRKVATAARAKRRPTRR